MIIKVTAELDSVDRAELCARRVRDNVEGIRRINIRQKNFSRESNYFTNAVPYNTQGFGTYQTMLFPSYNNVFEGSVYNGAAGAETGSEASLEIECDDDNVSRVVSYLNAYGAVKIKKIY